MGAQSDRIDSSSFIVTFGIRFILSDPKVWGDPETFRPERFLGPAADSLPNPLVISFGYGMRCVPIEYFYK
jgi:cytochrome P450